jgi:hypothetical protein
MRVCLFLTKGTHEKCLTLHGSAVDVCASLWASKRAQNHARAPVFERANMPTRKKKNSVAPLLVNYSAVAIGQLLIF